MMPFSTQGQQNKINLQQFRPSQNRSIPNLLSVIRLLLIPLMIYLYLSNRYTWAAGVLIFSFATDVADGYIARRFNQVTPLGKILDPLADKLTQLIFTVALCFNYRQTIPLVVVLVIKELVMLLLGVFMLKRGAEPISAKWWGKLSTGAFYTAVAAILLTSDHLPDVAIWLLSAAVCVLMLFSLTRYIILFQKQT